MKKCETGDREVGMRSTFSLLIPGFAFIVVSGCAAEADPPLPFNHKTHVVEHKMTCVECHVGVETETWAGLPSAEDCLRCHAFRFTNNAQALAVTELAPKIAEPSWQHYYAVAPHAHVSHAAHVKAQVPCEKCHGNTGKSEVTRREQMLLGEALMYWCIECHQEKRVSTDCLTCHR